VTFCRDLVGSVDVVDGELSIVDGDLVTRKVAAAWRQK
jgi:hypothetical protein